MSSLIEVKNLNKKYRKTKALNNFSLEVNKGKIIGILGPNGSGKTTLIKILVGLLKKDSGIVLIDGHEPGVYTKSIVSYLPDRNFLNNWMKIEDSMYMYDDFFEDFNKEKFKNLIEFMGLNLEMRIEELSKGMTEKLNLSLVLAREAKVYILDEPIAGVDPVARDQILEAIIENYSKESTMIVTTHLVKDMENMFDEVAFIRNGELVLKGDAEELRMENQMQIDDLYKKIFG